MFTILNIKFFKLFLDFYRLFVNFRYFIKVHGYILNNTERRNIMVKCNVPNDPDKKGNLEERCDGPASDVYYQSEGIEDDTGVKIPTEDAVEEAKDWSEENKK